MISYTLSGLDVEIIGLLKKLEPRTPLSSLILDIENEFLHVLKVSYDDKLYGVLVFKGVRNRKGELMFVVNHAIAVEKIEKHFTSILVESLPSYAQSHGFSYVRFHANRDGIYRILRRHCGKPIEFVFQVEVNKWIHQANLHQHKQPVPVQQTPV